MQEWLLRQWNDIRGNFKFWLLGILGIAIVSSAVAITHGLFLWQQITIAGLFLLLFTWAMIASFKMQRPKTIITLENLESHVRDWLDRLELPIQRIADPNCHFLFQVTTVSGTPVGILRARDEDRYVTFASRLRLGPAHRAIYDQLEPQKKTRVRRALRLEAAKAKIEFVSDAAFEVITIQQRLPITETLTEAVFLVGLNETNFSAILVNETITAALEGLGEIVPLAEPANPAPAVPPT